MSKEDRPQKILYIVTHGLADPERATLPFVLANAALSMGVEAVIALQGDAVWLGVKGTAEHVFAGGLPPFKELLDGFLELGGRLLICSPCLQHRKMDPGSLVEKAQVVASAALTREILTAKAVLNY
ncbi:MAG: DsrE family protein [Thermodesulfobacteriota bacterium]